MEKKGWDVKKHYHLDTAWVATFSNGNGGRVLGVNSEMDALPGIGHACGHNLIAIAGVAVALAVKAALITALFICVRKSDFFFLVLHVTSWVRISQ
jgi:metal-dependent amidase/aminoacylase/carboxypeptidase family protein